MKVATVRGWAKAHPGKAAAFACAILANYAYGLPDVDLSNPFTQRAVTVGTFIGCALACWLISTIKTDQRNHERENTSPRPRIGPKLMGLLLIGSMATQQAHAFDPRLLRPPTPTSPVAQQGGSVVAGIIVIGGGGFFCWWLAKKCQQWFGPSATTNKINDRFNEYGYVEDYIDKGGTCPRLAEYNETSIDEEEAMFQLTLHLDGNGTAGLSAPAIVPRGTLTNGTEFARSVMEYTGIQGLGGMRGDPHFSGPNGPIEYGESPIYRDWDGSLVILDTNYWSYPDDLVTVERSPSAEGPWELVIAARIPRGTTVELNDASVGGVQFYRVSAAVQ